MWTQFWDMHSGGGQKEKWAHIYIEAPEAEAKRVFFNRFGHNPDRVTCTCCGPDYSVTEEPTLEQLTGHHRNCKTLQTPRDPETNRFVQPDDPWFDEHHYLEPGEEAEAERRGYAVDDRFRYGEYRTLGQYVREPDVLVIRAAEIKDAERQGEIPEQGYVWVGD